MNQKHSVFDYTVTITRKQKYLIVGSPEFGFQIAASALDLGQASPAEIGETVLKVFESINARLHSLALSGTNQPQPLRTRAAHPLVFTRERVPIREAAKILGLSRSTLRRMARQKDLDCERTPGGHLRFSLESLTDYLVKQSGQSAPPGNEPESDVPAVPSVMDQETRTTTIETGSAA